MGEIKLVTSLVLIAVFSIAMVSYVANFAADNNAAISLSDDPEFLALNSDLSGEVSNFNTNANASSQAFFESEITEGDETTRTGGQFKVGIVSLTSALTLVLDIIFSKIFGNDVGFAVLLTAFLSLLGYIAFRYIWKTWKGGQPD